MLSENYLRQFLYTSKEMAKARALVPSFNKNFKHLTLCLRLILIFAILLEQITSLLLKGKTLAHLTHEQWLDVDETLHRVPLVRELISARGLYIYLLLEAHREASRLTVDV